MKINEKFAKEFQQRKEREELINVRQEERKGDKHNFSNVNNKNNNNDESDDDDDGSSSDESEDDNAELLTPGVDLQILKTINALRKKDESIYDSQTRFFAQASSDNENDDNDDNREDVQKHKTKYYNDVVREQIVEKMNRDKNHNDDSDDDDDIQNNDYDDTRMADDGYNNNNNSNVDLKSKLQYDEEQENLRKAFLDSNDNEDDDEVGWLVHKGKSSQNYANVDPAHEKLVEKEFETLEKQNNHHKEDETELSDSKGNTDQFLFDFIKNKRWEDNHDSNDEMNEDGSDDENEDSYNNNNNTKKLLMDSNDDGHNSDVSLDDLERMDQFESKYNYRFEEAAAANNNDASGAGYSVVGYSRSSLSNTIRRQDDTRKQKRLQTKERKEAERKAKEEKLRRLKNAKRQEMEERSKEIRAVVGDKNIDMEGDNNIDEETMMKLMEGDFDPAKFDEMMNKNYGDGYYDEDEKEWTNDVDVREALKKDEEDVVVEEGAKDGGLYDDYDEAVEEDDANEKHLNTE